MASSPQIPPVGLEGEFRITPLILGENFFSKSSKSGSKLCSEIVSTKIGSASDNRTNSGKETQYGRKTTTSSP